MNIQHRTSNIERRMGKTEGRRHPGEMRSAVVNELHGVNPVQLGREVSRLCSGELRRAREIRCQKSDVSRLRSDELRRAREVGRKIEDEKIRKWKDRKEERENRR